MNLPCGAGFCTHCLFTTEGTEDTENSDCNVLITTEGTEYTENSDCNRSFLGLWSDGFVRAPQTRHL